MSRSGSKFMLFWRSGWFSVLLFLTACSSTPTVQPLAQGGATHWQGRLALKVEGPAAQAWTAFFELDGTPEYGSLVLNSLFGNRLARMQWAPHSASLQTPSDTLQFSSLEAMAAHHTPSPIPVAALFSWLQGQRVDVKGWEVSMDQLQQGRLSALQRGPDSALMELKIILER